MKKIINEQGEWGLGIGDWGWGLGPSPNPQSPIPNPQSPIPIFPNFGVVGYIYYIISYIYIN